MAHHHWPPLAHNLFAAIFCILWTTVASLNIDTQFPVVFRFPHRLGNLSDSPHFGHSVLILDSLDVRNSKISFLIGAPNENTSVPHAGSIYQCQVGSQSDETRCDQVATNDARRTYTPEMHLGFNLIAQPNWAQHYVSCAYAHTSWHPYIGNALHPNGACYQFKLGQKGPIASILPLTDSEKQYKNVTINRESMTIMYYSYAMAGFSSAFSSNGRRLFLGVPGFENWRGGLLEIEPYDTRNDPSWQGNFAPYKEIMHKVQLNTTLNDVYIGYSMAIGRFFNSSGRSSPDEFVVMGAPRVDFVGSVAFFELSNNRRHSIQLNGAQSGEYFGSSLLVMDINRDGLDDLLVGAPMYSSYKKAFSDEGRVFVYVSNGESLVKRNILYGSEATDARFGTSMASLGDINRDGFNDIVIGAPYEEGGRGAIYVYRGRQDGLSTNFIQVAASDLPRLNLFGFGYSLSSQVDVDANEYNDLFVGSYLSNNAVLLRTRPITLLQASMQLSQDYFDPSQRCPSKLLTGIQSNSSCVIVKICFDTTNFDESYQSSVDVTLWLDSQLAPSAERCSIILDNDNSQKVASTLKTTMQLSKNSGSRICSQNYTVLLKEKVGNYLDPIVFTLSYNFAQTQLNRANIFKVPVVEGAMVNQTAELYIRMCGKSAKECVANMQLRPSVQLDEEEEMEATKEAVELVDGLHRKVRMAIWSVNLGQPAFDSKLNFSCNSTVSLISLDQTCRLISSSNDTLSIIECALESPLNDRQLVTIVMNPFVTFKPVHCSLSLAIANKLHWDSLVQENIVFQRVKRAAIDLIVTEAPLIRYKSESGNASFESIVRIQRTNVSTIDLLELQLIYPASYEQKPLASIFLTSNLNDRIPARCENAFDYSISDEQPSDSFHLLTEHRGQKTLNLSCLNQKILKCKIIKCRIGPMLRANVLSYIKFSSKLLVTSIDDKFGHYMFDQIAFSVGVRAIIIDEHIQAPAKSMEKTIEFLFKPVEPILDEPVPKWPYIVGVLVGLLIIILLIWILAKFGFFKRGSANISKEVEGDEATEENEN